MANLARLTALPGQPFRIQPSKHRGFEGRTQKSSTDRPVASAHSSFTICRLKSEITDKLGHTCHLTPDRPLRHGPPTPELCIWGHMASWEVHQSSHLSPLGAQAQPPIGLCCWVHGEASAQLETNAQLECLLQYWALAGHPLAQSSWEVAWGHFLRSGHLTPQEEEKPGPGVSEATDRGGETTSLLCPNTPEGMVSPQGEGRLRSSSEPMCSKALAGHERPSKDGFRSQSSVL